MCKKKLNPVNNNKKNLHCLKQLNRIGESPRANKILTSAVHRRPDDRKTRRGNPCREIPIVRSAGSHGSRRKHAGMPALSDKKISMQQVRKNISNTLRKLNYSILVGAANSGKTTRFIKQQVFDDGTGTQKQQPEKQNISKFLLTCVEMDKILPTDMRRLPRSVVFFNIRQENVVMLTRRVLRDLAAQKTVHVMIDEIHFFTKQDLQNLDNFLQSIILLNNNYVCNYDNKKQQRQGQTTRPCSTDRMPAISPRSRRQSAGLERPLQPRAISPRARWGTPSRDFPESSLRRRGPAVKSQLGDMSRAVNLVFSILLTSFNNNFFKNTLEILRLSNRIHLVEAICFVCKKQLTISSGKIEHERALPEIIVGKNLFQPVCISCKYKNQTTAKNHGKVPTGS